ncbi:MAG: cell division protein ZapD [Gammaproteobacteria bacterium]|nr:cell division protein ZapD [Gammaproteobacteria bacterium]MDH3767078.1 cell division protein ZapD [Gammaproteobacteria bacterium]
MTSPAPSFFEPEQGLKLVSYEQPLTERMRTFLRLEFLFRQVSHHSAGQSTWETRAAVASLLDVLAIVTRADVRKDVLHELERYASDLQQFRARPGVDNARLAAVLASVESLRDQLNGCHKQLARRLADCDFLSSVRHRSTIPGGTCEFDLPDYSHWLNRTYDRRRNDFNKWLEYLRPLRDAVNKLLWLTREGAPPVELVAIGGMYQHVLARKSGTQLLRVSLPEMADVYPEISGNQHRFTVRFQQWGDIGIRPSQTGEDVTFYLACC